MQKKYTILDDTDELETYFKKIQWNKKFSPIDL